MKKTFIYLFGTVLLAGTSSCQKYLELQPQDGIIKEEFWKTKEQVQASVTGIYSSMMEYASGGYNSQGYIPSMAELFFVWGESRADNIATATASSFDDIALTTMNVQPTNVNANWRPFYRTINFCNTVLEKAPEVLTNDNTFTQRQLDIYMSEALTVRALMYFYLVRTFGDVPLKLDATLSDENITPIPKSTQAAVLDQIIADLKKAESLAVTTHGIIDQDKGRVTRYTVNAILADVYLWTEKYTECVAECDKVINSGRFGLIRGATVNGPTIDYNDSWFTTLYVDGNSNEGIFELQYSQQRLNPYFTIFSPSIPARRWVATADLMERVFSMDMTNPLNYDIRGDRASVAAATSTVWKYIGASPNLTRTIDQSFAHWIFYRYADILMMKAEALNESGNGQGALNLVYQIRQRANALVSTDLMPSPSDKFAVQDFILEERAREFCFEGKRWFDVLRNAKRNKYARLSIMLNMIAQSVPSNMQQSAQTKAKDVNSHYMPIYLYELQTNKKLLQNPFYK